MMPEPATAVPVTPEIPLIVEFYFDVVCPWSFVGKRRLDRAIADRPDYTVSVRWLPFLLNPELPQGGLDRTAYLMRKFGSEQRVSAAMGSVSEAGQSVEINFAFERISRTPNTLNAHRMVRIAAHQGREEPAVEALFRAYFMQGLDIGETDVLLQVARDLDIDENEVIASFGNDGERTAIFEGNALAHRLGINGSPSFVFPGSLAISGAQEPTVLTRLLDVAAAGV